MFEILVKKGLRGYFATPAVQTCKWNSTIKRRWAFTCKTTLISLLEKNEGVEYVQPVFHLQHD